MTNLNLMNRFCEIFLITKACCILLNAYGKLAIDGYCIAMHLNTEQGMMRNVLSMGNWFLCLFQTYPSKLQKLKHKAIHCFPS